MSQPRIFVSLKAFGDLVIAATELERSESKSSDFRLLIGSHLRPLASALDLRIRWSSLDHGENQVPAMYDIRRQGLLLAARSFIAVRNALSSQAGNDRLMFDRAGARELALTLPHLPHALPQRPNIYLAYRALIGGNTTVLPAKEAATALPTIGIFPGSRLASKQLPADLVDALCAACAAHGWIVRLLLLDGERPDLQSNDRTYELVPRQFGAMIAAVQACDAVISADSLPAHLAERAGLPVFVVSPVENHYWLPLSSFEAGRYSLFETGLSARPLARFIDSRGQ